MANTEMLPEFAHSTAHPPVPKATAPVSAWYGLGVLIAATLLSFVDREILALVAEPVRHALGMSDTQLGLLQGLGMALFAGLASLPVAWLADRFGRRSVLVASILIWSAATAGCGAARSFHELFIAMVMLGIGQAGLGPVVFGLIPDLFPPRQRVLANTLYSLVATLGAALGLVVGGPLVAGIDTVRAHLPAAFQSVAAWRLAFYFVALPGPLMALAILPMQLRREAPADDPQGQAMAADGVQPSLVGYVRTQWRTVVGLFGSFGLIGLGFSAIGTWSPIIAARNFNATPTDVGQGLGAAVGIGTLVGGVLVTPAARWLGPRFGPAASLRLIELGIAMTVPLCVLLCFVHSSAQMFAVICMQVAPVTVGSTLFNAAMQDMSPANLRSRVLAVGLIVSLGFATISPVAVGMLSDALKLAPKALLWAMVSVAITGLVLGALLMRWSERAFAATVRSFTPEPSTGA